jgi:hypothetical protein
MDQCSEYIAKLEGYRKNNVMYRRKNESAAWGRSIQKFIEQELTEFYTNFDSTFTIVSKFIVWILIDMNLQNKDGELLNTELGLSLWFVWN